MTKTVAVRHTSQLLPAAAVAALNDARLDASLHAPREQTKMRGSWLPPWRGVYSFPRVFIYWANCRADVQFLPRLEHLILGFHSGIPNLGSQR